jgi:hypothetical protein
MVGVEVCPWSLEHVMRRSRWWGGRVDVELVGIVELMR